MVDMETEDTLTRLNTQLNRSMVLMDYTMDDELPSQKSGKSIKINTKAQPASPSNGLHNTSRKSILKKSDKNKTEQSSNSEPEEIENELERLNQENQERVSANTKTIPRPQNLRDLQEQEDLTTDSEESSFNFNDISGNEEVWIMEVPRTINPQDLKEKILTLKRDKSKFKVNGERYCAVKQFTMKSNITCVVNCGKTKQQYKTVNIKPKGTIAIRRKLSAHTKIQPISVESSSVPFPKNLKTRHPLFGINQEGKVKKSSIKASG